MKQVLCVMAVAILMVGCGGGDTYVRVQGTTTISKGKELVDLQRAFDEGAIDSGQYERLKARILRRPD